MDKSKATKKEISLLLDFSEVVAMLDEAWQNDENIYIAFNGKKHYAADLGEVNKYSYTLMHKWGKMYEKSKDPSADITPSPQHKVEDSSLLSR